MDDALLTHDEPCLARELSLLPRRAKAAFAAACAGRLAAALAAIGADAGLVSSALDRLRAFAAGEEPGDATALEAHLLAALPDEDEKPGLAAGLAEDALAAAAYALRCAADGHAQDAVWAARRAYETVDRFASQDLPERVFTAEVEVAILRHPAVQTELRRQRRDLGELRAAGDDAARLVRVVERAAHEPILS